MGNRTFAACPAVSFSWHNATSMPSLTTCNTAGLHTVTLQQLHPDATVATVEALATLQSLRTLDMP